MASAKGGNAVATNLCAASTLVSPACCLMAGSLHSAATPSPLTLPTSARNFPSDGLMSRSATTDTTRSTSPTESTIKHVVPDLTSSVKPPDLALFTNFNFLAATVLTSSRQACGSDGKMAAALVTGSSMSVTCAGPCARAAMSFEWYARPYSTTTKLTRWFPSKLLERPWASIASNSHPLAAVRRPTCFHFVHKAASLMKVRALTSRSTSRSSLSLTWSVHT
mmetsp:Transcript_16681/g.42424  ORF Transcript_16681/g.42424 Transcript_16681/m.42424 type:complete len:222 (+) Transcript_16681:731-1396(+)